jgi:hypothetical protein
MPDAEFTRLVMAALWTHFEGGDVDAGLAALEETAGTMIDDLLRWTEALKKARTSYAGNDGCEGAAARMPIRIG